MFGSRLWIAIVILGVVVGTSSADALLLNLDFALDNQTYTWNDSLFWQNRINSRTQLQVFNRSNATLIKSSVFGAGADRWQKYSRTRGQLTRRFGDKLEMGLEIHQDFDRLESRRFIGNGALATTQLDWRWLRATGKVGPVWEQRDVPDAKSTQSGLGQEAQIEIVPQRDFSLGMLTLNSSLNTLRETPHKSVQLGYNLTRSFTGKDTTSLNASQSFAEQKFFPSSTDFSQTARQRSELRQFDLDVRRALPAEVYFQARSSYLLTSYKYDYERIEQGLITQNNNLRLLFDYQFNLSRRLGNWLLLETEYLFDRTKEDFGRDRVNQRSETGRWSMGATFYLMERDTLVFYGQIGVTSYFTPGASSVFSDRDRTLQVGSVRLVHRFNRYLRGTIEGSYRGFHTIYVSGTLSANNNQNNVFVLSPSLSWQPFAGVKLEQFYQMHANYIYYDYEKSTFAGRNTLYRRANLLNRLTLSGSPATDFELEYSYRYEDFGPVRYTDQWQQQVSWDRRTQRPKISVYYHPTRSFRFRPYASYEVQRSYDHVFDEDNVLGRREQTEKFIRKVIGFELQWYLSDDSYVDSRLERRIQTYATQRNQDYDIFTISLKRSL